MCVINNVTLEIKSGDITREKADAIVNAANSGLAGGGGVDGAIHRAGGPAIMEECRKIGFCPTGEAVVTTAGNLDASHIIHAVGPVWRGGAENEGQALSRTYENCMKRAREYGIKSLAFPAISAGTYGFPAQEAADIAVSSVIRELKSGPGKLAVVTFVLFNETIFSAFESAMKKYCP